VQAGSIRGELNGPDDLARAWVRVSAAAVLLLSCQPEPCMHALVVRFHPHLPLLPYISKMSITYWCSVNHGL
jgi:hypothetical protein